MESKNINKVIAVVVWYNPNEKMTSSISLYNKDVEYVVIIDNSENDNSHLTQAIPNAIYIPLYKNTGIATALNTGCEKALSLGSEWVMTMDQDSEWNQQSVKEYISIANQYEAIDKTAIFSPFHDCDSHPEKHHKTGLYEEKKVIMCSGNLLRLDAWKNAGGFREDFFIDSVDDEICCHLRKMGWKIVRINNINLTHNLGNGAQYLPHTRKLYISHSPWRYYYIARNIRQMIYLYPDMRSYYRTEILKYIKRLCLYDWNEKADKLREFIRGWKDGKKAIAALQQA